MLGENEAPRVSVRSLSRNCATMKPLLGWAGLSRSALKRAEAQLVADGEGVRDEVGVLSVHTAYANRFFPGTSVQQTRLRYALFVPWQIKMLLGEGERVHSGQADDALEQAELDLCRRLPNVDGEGTIGRRMAMTDRSVAIPPSQSYWVALRAWGILNAGPGGYAASRSELFAHWEDWSERRSGRPATDDEGRSLEAGRQLLHPGLPEPPVDFNRNKRLGFRLREEEREFLRARLLETRRHADGQPSFLSALVRSRVHIRDGMVPWSSHLMRNADDADQKAIRRARDAAALTACTRAIYSAAVEALRQHKDGESVGNRHRDHLVKIVDKYGRAAQRLCLADLPLDGVKIGGLAAVLEIIQQWLSRGSGDPLDETVLATLSRWEMQRKGTRRAKLPLSAHGREARAAWQAEKAPLAIPIGFRWNLVCRFLRDLQD